MSKSRWFMLLGVIVLSLALVGIGLAADNAPEDVDGSTVNYIFPDEFSPTGETVDLCFNVYVNSPDSEYLDGFDFDLPDDWTVNSVTDVPGTGCGLGHTFGVNPGNVVYWYTNGMPSGCGDWYYGTYDFCANVTVPAGCTGGWELPWNIWGDQFGVPPNSVSGVADASCGGEQACTSFSEQFETWPPEGWEVVNYGGSCDWANTAITGYTNNTGGTGSAADANSDWCGSGTSMNTGLLSPVFSLEGTANPSFSYNFDYYDIGTTDQGAVDISTDGGASWTNLVTYASSNRGPASNTLDLSAYAGQPTVQLRFTYIAPTWDWWFQVDDAALDCGAPAVDPDIDVQPTSLTQELAPDTSESQVLTISNVGVGDLEWAITEEPTYNKVPYVPGTESSNVNNKLSSGTFTPPAKTEVMKNAGGHTEELINDGSFEFGPPPSSAWTEFTSQPCEWIGDWSGVWGVPAFDGIYDYWAGGYCGGVPTTSYVNQVIHVPAAGQTLSFWYLSYRPDPDDGGDDYAYLSVNGTQVWTLSLIQANNNYPNFSNATVDLSAYADQDVTLEFGAVSGGASTGNVRFDFIEWAGVSVTCTNPADIPWLTEEPISGITPGPGSTEVTVTFDATGLSQGTYTGNLCVNSNDPDEPLVAVPVELNVTGGTTAGILLVDDDDNSPDVRSYYTDALDSLGLTYTIWDTANSDNEPDATYLAGFDTVIWFTGDEFGGFAGPGAAGETALAEWLDSGGGGGGGDLVGDWMVYWDWYCYGYYSNIPFHFAADGTFYDDFAETGTWDQNGDQVEWFFDGRTDRWYGTINGDHIDGGMEDPGGAYGCMYADRLVTGQSAPVMKQGSTAVVPLSDDAKLRSAINQPANRSIDPTIKFTPPTINSEVLVDQAPNGVNGLFVDSSCSLCPTGQQSIADNFVLDADTTVEQIIFWSGYYPMDTPIDPDILRVLIHEDAGGVPGAVVYDENNVAYTRAQTGVILFGVHEWQHELTLAGSGVSLPAGTYWLEIFNNTGGDDDDFFWETGNTDPIHGIFDSQWAQETPGVVWMANGGYDSAMQIIGTPGGAPGPHNPCLLLSSQDYIYDRGVTQFATDYLGVASNTNDVGALTITGEGSVYAGLGPYAMSYPGSDYADTLVKTALAEYAFFSENGDSATDQFGATYFTTFQAFSLEGVPNVADRASVLSTFLGACGAVVETPDIDVTPTELSSTQPPDTSVPTTLTIANTGGGELVWNIEEDNSAALVPYTPGTASQPVDNSLSAGSFTAQAQNQVMKSINANLDALINDGSFENGPPPGSAWTEVTDQPCEWIGDWSGVWGVPAFDGFYDYWAGGYCGGVPTSSNVSQLVSVPATGANLSFWYISYRPDPDDGGDFAYISVNGTNVWTLDLIQANNTYPNFVNTTVDLSAYAGQDVTLAFGAVSGGASTGNIRFDFIEWGGTPQVCSAPSDIPWLTEDPTNGSTPGGSSTDVTVTFNSAGLAEGTYTGDLCVTSNDPDEPLVVVPVTLDVVGAPADISVDPTSLEQTLPPDDTATQQLTISNIGESPLIWSLEEIAGVKSISIHKPSVAPILSGNGAITRATNNPQAPAPVANPEDVLWDQTTDYSQGGIGDNFPPEGWGAFSADDFTNADPWQIESIFVPGWQYYGNIYNATALNWCIYPDAGGVPAGHPYEGGEYFCFSKLPTDPSVTIGGSYGADITVDVVAALGAPIDVPAGTWWFVFYPDFPNSGSDWYYWFFGTSSNGANAMLVDPMDYFGIGATNWTPWASQGIPYWDMAFRLEGQIGQAFDLPWLSETPLSGTVQPGDSVVVDVTFDSTGLAPDVYTGALRITSNDPDEPVVDVPVTLTVGTPEIVAPATLTLTLQPGATGDLPFTLGNTGTADLVWSLTDSATWLSVLPTSGTVVAGGTESLVATFDATGLAPGTYTATITITSNDPNSPTVINVTLVVEPFSFFLPFIHK